MGYMWVSLIIDQSECLLLLFICTELTFFYIELPETAFIWTNQNWVFFMYIIMTSMYIIIIETNEAETERGPTILLGSLGCFTPELILTHFKYTK